jgi:hypothetical protein
MFMPDVLECICTILSVMIIISKTAVETVQQSYFTKWSLYKAYPQYAGDKLLNTDSYTHTHVNTRQSIGKSKSLSNFSLGDRKLPVSESKTNPNPTQFALRQHKIRDNPRSNDLKYNLTQT